MANDQNRTTGKDEQNRPNQTESDRTRRDEVESGGQENDPTRVGQSGRTGQQERGSSTGSEREDSVDRDSSTSTERTDRSDGNIDRGSSTDRGSELDR